MSGALSIAAIVLFTIMRQNYEHEIHGYSDCCNSCCTVFWCMPCAAGQMRKTLDQRANQQNIV